MVSHSNSDMSDAQIPWNASSYQSSEYPSGAFMADAAQLSKESYDTISKDASFSVATRSTHYADGSLQSYSDEEYSPVSERPAQPPPKKVEPTVFVLQHHIAPIEDDSTVDPVEDDKIEEPYNVATREEQDTERAGVEKEQKSFSRFRKHFGKKKKSHENSTDRVPAPKDEHAEMTLESPPPATKKSLRGKGFLLASRSRSKSSMKDNEKPEGAPPASKELESKPSKDKSSLQGKGFLRSRSKSLLKEGGEEHPSSEPPLESVSSNEFDDNDDEDDDDDESTVGGTLNTFDFNMFLGLDDRTADEYTRESSTLDGSNASGAPPDRKHAPVRRRSSSLSIREASTVAATPESSPSRDDISGGMTTDDGEKSVKSNKSNRSNVSIRSLGSIFKRKSRESSNDDLHSTKSEGNGRKLKKKRSWNPMKRRRSKRKPPPVTATKKPKKGILRKRSTPRMDSLAPPPVEEEQSPWEALLEGCDVVCCKPLFGETGSDNGSIDGRSHTPSEIYINTEASKTLVTV